MHVMRRLQGYCSSIFALLFFASLIIIGCSDDPVSVEGDEGDTTSTEINNPPPGDFDARGTVSGRVLDRVTNAPIEGADVSIDAAGETRSATTGADGSFRLTGVPANTSDEEDQAGSGTYNVHVQPNDERYRENYSAEVTLVFGRDDGGSGAANNLGASVTFPLAKVTGSVEGTLVSEAGLPVTSAEVQLYQDLDLRFGDDGGSVDGDVVKVATDTSGEDGSFAFGRVEEASTYSLRAKVGEEPQSDFLDISGTGDPILRELPPSSEGNAEDQLEEVTVPNEALPALTATLEPAIGTDFDTKKPEWTLTFSRPAAGVTPAAIEEEISINEGSIQTKAVGPLGEIDIEADTTQASGGGVSAASWTVADSLSDGIEFEVERGNLFGAIAGARYGAPLASVNGAAPSSLPFALDYSIGADRSAPATPVAGADGNVRVEPCEICLAVVPEFADYSGESTAANIFIEVDNSQAEVKAYEFFVRPVERREDETVANQFAQAFTLNVDSRSEFGEIENDFLFASSFFGGVRFPFATDDGAYGPIEWKVRAVSVNNVRSEFSEVQTLGDAVSPRIGAADGNVGDNSVTIFTNEPLVRSPDANSAENTANYTLRDATGTERDVIADVELENVPADEAGNPLSTGDFSGSTRVTVTLEEGESFQDGDELEISTDVQDLAGNGFDDDFNVVEFNAGSGANPATKATSDNEDARDKIKDPREEN